MSPQALRLMLLDAVRIEPAYSRNASMRRSDSSRYSMLVAKLRRTQLSSPKSLPGTTPTWASSRRRLAQSVDPDTPTSSYVSDTSGKT